MTHKIELRRISGDKSFGRGERAIYVDGVRWGRTRVSYHGCWGLSYSFHQSDGDLINGGVNEHGHTKSISVKSGKMQERGEARSTEERILEKVKELIASSRLRHPDVVKAELDAEHALYQFRAAAAERKEQEKLNDKANSVLRQLKNYIVLGSNEIANEDDVKLVVEAMKWAQTQ